MLLKVLKLFLNFYFICIDCMHGTMCMPDTCGGRKNGVGFLGIGVTDGCESQSESGPC